MRISLLGYNLLNETKTLLALPWTQANPKTLRLHLSADQSMQDSLSSDRADTADTALNYQADVPARQADNDSGELLFTHTFAYKTLVAGPSKLVVYMSAKTQDDIDVYVQVRKADAGGTIL